MTWTLRDAKQSTFPIYALAFGNNLFVAAGAANNVLATSPDGITWTTRTHSFGSTDIWGVGYGSGLWVACGNSGQLATSSDAFTWTQRTSSFGTSTIWSVSYGNGLWVATGNAGKLATSSDGINWTQQTSSFGTSVIFKAFYNGSLWVAVGASGKLATSSDGINWTQQTSSFTAINIRNVLYANGLWVAIAETGKLATSSDGINWTQQTTGFGANDIYALTYGGNKWIIGGAGSNKIASSSDAVNWSFETNPITDLAIWSACFGNARFVVGASGGQLATSEATTPVTLTPVQGLINVIGLDWTRAFTTQPGRLSIAITGEYPKTHLDTFKRSPIQGQLALLGDLPGLQLGFNKAPSIGQINLAGQQPTFANRLLYLISPGWISTRYRCVLTGSADNVSDVELPIKSFQTRFTDNYIYFSCIIPGVDAYQSSINSRSNGRLSVWRVYDYLDKSTEEYLLVSVPFESFRLDSGGRSGLTATLSGNDYMTNFTPLTIELFDTVYYSETDNANRRYRCRLDPRLRVGDTALINGDVVTIATIIHIVDVKSTLMEIAEA